MANSGALWRQVAPGGVTWRDIKMWQIVSQCGAYRIKLWRHLAIFILSNKKKGTPHFATYRYISPLGDM